jgi:(p)ppGpp synthase/HD superfamily hydrolase
MSERRPRPELGGRFLHGLQLAFELHQGQARKTAPDEPPGVSYLGHLLGVAGIVIDAEGSEDQAIAALLHDAAEDQGGEVVLERIETEFGETVRRIVAECSDTFEQPKPPWRQRKEAYLAHLDEVSAETVLVSLADKLYNVRSIVLDLRESGEDVWRRFNADADPLWYYESLASIFGRLRPGTLADELAREVDELRRLASVTGA